MNTYCGANCESCQFRENCKGCLETGGSPFGGRCVAAEYVKAGGLEAYLEFKQKLLGEVNTLLAAEGIGAAEDLYELVGAYVNLEYELPSGERVKFLDDKNVYLGAQIETDGMEICFGVVADVGFILLCSYGENGADPELIAYHKR